MVLARKEFDATDEGGNRLTDVSVRVEREGGGLVPVYSDRDGTSSLGNPFLVADGKVAFHAPGGAYRITLTKGAYTRVLRYQPLGLMQESDVGTIAVDIDASGVFAGRAAHNSAAKGFIYLSLNGDGVTGVWTLYTKLSAAAGDWSAGQQVPGEKGGRGDPGLIGDWRGAWESGTYNELDAVEHNGSAYIVKVGVVSTTQEPPGSDWELVAARGGEGLTAYEVAVAQGFVGDEAAWLASLSGADGLGIPPGGTTGQVLKKASNADIDTVWADDEGSGVPAGGSTGQVLKKASSADGDAVWADESGGVVGPAAAGDARIAVFDGTSGKLLKDGGKTLSEVLVSSNKKRSQTWLEFYRNPQTALVGTTSSGTWLYPGNATSASSAKWRGDFGCKVLYARWILVWTPGASSTNSGVRLCWADDGPSNIVEIGRLMGNNATTPVTASLDVTASLNSMTASKQLLHQTQGNGSAGVQIYSSVIEIVWESIE